MAYARIHLLCSRPMGLLGGRCHPLPHRHLAWLLSLAALGGNMNEADKAYLAVRVEEEEQHDPWEFLAQQIKGIIAFVAIVTGVWMLVAAVVLK